MEREKRQQMTVRAWTMGFFVALFAVPATAAIPAKHHMIVAAEPYAAEAGLEMLRAGGSAVDAAIAAQVVLTLVEPQSSGIGGGAYLLVAEPNSKLHAYDGREIAPASAKQTMFLDASGKPRNHADMIPGGLSVGVPGDIAMLAQAHAAHGRLPWAKLFEPAIRLAEQGFRVPPRMAADVRLPENASMPDLKVAYFHSDGAPLAAGETWRNPAYAETLHEIAQGGADAFYKGKIADEIVGAVAHATVNPTVMTRADFAAYQVKERIALCGTYRLYRVCSLPPSTSGGITLLQTLGLLQHFKSDQLKPGTLSAVHLISQAERLAYSDRGRWIGDPDFVDVPLAGLLDKNYLASRARLIDPARDMGLAQAGTPAMKGKLDYAPLAQPRPPGTSHMSVVDDRGEVVSLTMSIESEFGSKLMAGGFVLNNELTDFAFVPKVDGRPVANAPAPHKRPMSAMTPTIIFGPNGKFFAAFGSPDGPRIIGYVIQTASALIDGKLSMAEAIGLPHHVNLNGDTLIEKATRLEEAAPALTAMGHQVTIRELVSGLNGIRRVAHGYEGAADLRREGVALGD
jgi:gamma-glutamyltranspeptidase/glutathione hydrolase